MLERIIDISQEGARLSIAGRRLVVAREGETLASIPLDEMGALVISHRAVVLTQPVLAALAEAGAPVIVCDSKCLPAGMMLPIEGHHLQAERLAQQVQASAPLCKQAWKQIVQAKVRAQGRLLHDLYGDDKGIAAMAARVKSGDPGNIEGQASRRYWPALFANPGFRRDRDLPDQNKNLNYGYAVLRAIVARAVCAAGLHPSLGIHHHNRYDAFALADDLMEPFRPVVDRAVAGWLRENDPLAALTPQAKAALIGPLMQRFTVKGEERSLFDIAARAAVSLTKMFAGAAKSLVLPEL
ncbi:MAG TPA: type II CRISPR-associated endonuclease Cas1 [Candidatus Hydrogenedentes bacterium]|nr:type II CRISPR-associated endonuclease Cas1 [Candidatus Hydrogenedentota bacterium]